MSHVRNVYRVLRSIILTAILFVVGVYVVLYVAISLPWVQNEIRLVAERELSTLLGTNVSIGSVYISPGGEVRLTDVRVPSPDDAPCISISRLGAGIDLGELIRDRRICFTYGEIVGLDAHLLQKEDGAPWNIQFIIDALKPKDPTKPPTKFDITLRNVVIRKSNVAIDREWKAHVTDRLDFNHIRLENLRADVSMPRLKNDDFIIDLRRLSVSERSGVDLEKLACLVHITPHGLSVENLALQFPGTNIEIPSFDISYNGYNGIVKALRSKRYAVNFRNLRLTPYDFRALLPQLRRFQDPLYADIHAMGDLEHAEIERFALRGDSYGLEMELSGAVNNIRDAGNLRVKVKQLGIRVSAACVDMVLPLIPGIKDKPASMIRTLGGFTADISGEMYHRRASVEARIATGIGAAETDGTIDWSRKGVLDVAAKVSTPGFALGELLADNKLGTIVIDADAEVSISGRDINGHAMVDMPSFSYNGQQITDLVADVSKDGKNVTGSLAVQSSPLTVRAEGEAVIDGKATSINAKIDLAHFDPAAAGLGARLAGYSFSGNIEAAVEGLDPGSFTGYVNATGLHMESPKGPVDIDRLYVNAENYDMEQFPDGGRKVSIAGDFFDAIFMGHFDVAKLPKAATALVAQAMPALLPARLTESDYSSQDIDFAVTIHNDDTLADYLKLPVRLLTDIKISGNMNGPAGTADLSVDVPYLQQGKDKLIRNVNLKASLDASNRSALVDAGAILPGKDDTDVMVAVGATGIDDELRAKVSWDLNRQKAYRGNVEMQVNFSRDPLTGNQSFGARFIPSTFSVADAVWNVGEGTVRFEGGVLSVDNVSVWHDQQFVNIHGTASRSYDDMIQVDLADIDLDYIFETLNINYVTFGGRATGKAVARSVFDFKNMDAHTEGLKVKNLQYNNGLLGDAELSGRFDPKEMKVAIGADISEHSRHVADVDGGIWVTRDSLAFRMDTEKINIKFLQPFMQAFTTDVSGRASGHVNLFGTFKDIDMTGRVFADSLRMKVDYTNVYYSGSDSVIMTPGRIEIPHFRIYDRYGNSAVLTGHVAHKYFHDPTFEFRVRDARNLLCYNTDSRINPDWYGTIFGRGGGSIVGRPGYVGIMVDMTVGPKSVFNFVLNDAEAVADYQFLEFTDRRTAALEEERIRLQEERTDTVPGFVKAFRHRREQEQKQAEIPSIFSLDLRATVTPEAEMILVMDPVGGDRIRAHGSGALQIGYSSDSDEMTMYGKYTLADGYYNFTLQDLIIKDFTIRPGSNIQFNGDPLKALLDINAIYRVNTNLTDLDKSFASDRDLNRTNVPVDAVLSVRGDLEAPDISFDIELPTLTSDVARKVKSIISTEDMMSRQIIYLLALNRFYTPEYMGTTSSGGEWASVASATVTSQLTNMLSQLTDKFTVAPSLRSDKGDFSDMEVDVALSSRLLNNRLLINGNLGYRDRSTSSTTFIGDFDVEYLLNRSGNLRLKAYNHFNDQNYYLKSSLTTQGIGVVYRKDFDNMFKFLRPKRKKEEQPDSTAVKNALPAKKEEE